MDARNAAVALGFALCIPAVHGFEPSATVVEYYNPNSRAYFMTASAAEVAFMDSGAAGPGWARTGGEFSVFASAAEAPGSVPVCRFHGTPGVGPASYFYSADPGECEFVKTLPAWTYEGTAFHAFALESGSCPSASTTVWRSYNNGGPRDANHRYTVDRTAWSRSAANGYTQEGAVMCVPLSSSDIEADAVRLLRQATFGPKESELAHVRQVGVSAWLDEQFALPATQYTLYPYVPAARPGACVNDSRPPVRPDSFCARDNYTLFPLQTEFFRNALGKPDQLRQRVAFALSQILVTSGLDNSRNYAMRHYQQIFLDTAFGNYFDVLTSVTLSPVMGDYLDMVNNNKANPAANTEPNENYGREILQLFSIGTILLNPDGTPRTDSTGKAIPSYEQDTIEGFAHVFTGWTYPTIPGQPARNNNPRNFLGPMRPVNANHDFGTKKLLSNVVAPTNLTMQQDLEFAHRNIFNHPNVGPFIGKQLIQKLVTSDPTAEYVARVAAAFDNNGFGQRGDLRAVVLAILTDPEARGARKIDPGYGKLAEPVLYMTSLTRALDARTDGVHFRTASSVLGQFLFYPPSVFNYYSPRYVVPGTSLLGPEFGLQTTSTAISRANFANVVFTGLVAPDPTVYGSTGTTLDLSAYQAVAGDANELVERTNRLLLAGRMSRAMKDAILSAVNAVPARDLLGRARTAVWLAMTSPQYQVER